MGPPNINSALIAASANNKSVKAKIKTNTAYYFQRDFNSTHAAVLFCVDEVTSRALLWNKQIKFQRNLQIANLAKAGLYVEYHEEAVISESGVLLVSIPRLSMHIGPTAGVKP